MVLIGTSAIESAEQDVGVDGQHGLFPSTPPQRHLNSSPLRFNLDFLIGQPLPTKPARLGRVPLPVRIRIRSVHAEDVLDPTSCELGQRYLTGFAKPLRTSRRLIRELDPGSRHAIALTAVVYAVNATAWIRRTPPECGAGGPGSGKGLASPPPTIASRHVPSSPPLGHDPGPLGIPPR